MLRPQHLVVPLIMMGLSVGTAAAAPVTATLFYRGDASDNILKEQSAPTGALRHLPRVALEWQKLGSTLNARAAYSVSARRYTDVDLPDETVAPGSFGLDAVFLDRRLTLSATHVRSEALADIRQVDRPDNRSETDQFAVRARYEFSPQRPGGLFYEGNAERSVSSGAIVDSERVGVTVGWQGQRSSGLSYGVDGGTQRIRYDERGLPENRTSQFAVSLGREFRELSISARTGMNRFERQGSSSSSGALFDISLGWQPAATRQLTFAFRQQFSDRSLQGRGVPILDQTRANGLFGEALENGQVFEDRTYSLQFSEQRERWSARFNVALGEQDFDGDSEDRESTQTSANFSYRLTRQIDLFLSGTARSQQIGDRDDDRLQLTGGVALNLGRDTRVRYGYIREEQDSSVGQDFVERVFFLEVSRVIARQRATRTR